MACVSGHLGQPAFRRGFLVPRTGGGGGEHRADAAQLQPTLGDEELRHDSSGRCPGVADGRAAGGVVLRVSLAAPAAGPTPLQPLSEPNHASVSERPGFLGKMGGPFTLARSTSTKVSTSHHETLCCKPYTPCLIPSPSLPGPLSTPSTLNLKPETLHPEP